MLVSWRLFLKMRYLSYVDDSINSTFDLWDSILCTSLLNRSFINSCCFTSSVPFLPFPHLPFQLPYFLSSSGLQESSCLYWWWKHLHAKYLRALIAMSSLSNVHFPSAGQYSAQVFLYFFHTWSSGGLDWTVLNGRVGWFYSLSGLCHIF